MADKSKPSRREALEKRAAEIANQLKALNARETAQERKNDTRRKVIAGALALEHRAKNPGDDFSKKLDALLHEYVKPNDRALFDLPAKAAE
jgi:hypothetical protein